MLRSLFVAGVFAISTAAGAVTLTMTPDDLFPTSQVVLTIQGDAEGVAGLGVYGRLLFDPAVFSGVSASQSQFTSFGGVFPWTLVSLSCGVGFCETFSQLVDFVPYVPDNTLTSVVVLDVIGSTAGTEIRFETDPLTGFQFWFFGISNPPSLIFPVPEPGTASLLGLGLLGLASAQRRRRILR